VAALKLSSIARTVIVLATPLALVTSSGCSTSRGAPPQPAAKAEAPLTPAERAAAVEEQDQRTAQRAWCGYLQALYLRAADGGATSWPRYQQCTQVTTMASPQMLKRTADCSLNALQSFSGDPFTPEYAAEVTRCGSEALDAMIVTQTELAPFVATLCGRVASCGEVSFEDCRETLEMGLGPHLERAIGAINTRGRTQLRACLKTVSCDAIGAQVTTCLEPIMDDLLWLPG
jgi:hypothetical protein